MSEPVTLHLGKQSVGIEAGELVSYQVGGHEFIHQRGSAGWRNSDTEMFPIIGPTSDANFVVQVPRGNAILDQHGHLREMPYSLVSRSETTVSYKKEYTAGTPIKNSKFPEKSKRQWLMWPYSFGFEKTFLLGPQGLEITFTISSEKDMPFMFGYHPAFKLHTDRPVIRAEERNISLDEVLAVGSRALQVENCKEILLQDEKEIKIQTEGFGHFMLWTEVHSMVCIEPITFYPYSVPQQKLHEGFDYLQSEPKIFKVKLLP